MAGRVWIHVQAGRERLWETRRMREWVEVSVSVTVRGFILCSSTILSHLFHSIQPFILTFFHKYRDQSIGQNTLHLHAFSANPKQRLIP